MVHIETVDLTTRGLTFPSDRVGMVIAQPRDLLLPRRPLVATPRTLYGRTYPTRIGPLTAALTAALTVLESDIASPKEAASDCGFANVDTLWRAFVRAVGISQAGYRKRYASGHV